jgi:hypothetical protein
MARSEKRTAMEAWAERGGILLVNYETLASLEKEYAKDRVVMRAGSAQVKVFDAENPIDLVICDEAHRLKSTDLEAVKALRHLHAKRRLLLTGTPLQNHLLEYWSMVDFALPKFFDRQAFLRYFVNPIQRSASAQATPLDVANARKRTFILVQELAAFVHRVDSSPLRAELPPMREYVVTVPLSPLQHSLYEHFLALLRAQRGSHLNVLQAFSFASKICAHPVLLLRKRKEQQQQQPPSGFESLLDFPSTLDLPNKTYDMKVEDGHKLVVAARIVYAAAAVGERSLVFSLSTKLLDCFEWILQQMAQPSASGAGLEPIRFLRLDGSHSTKEREASIRQFQASESSFQCFLLSTKAGGVGITVTNATRVVFLDCGFNPVDDRQAIGRAYRYGQTKPVVVYRLVCHNTIEHRVFDQKIAKEWLFQTVVEQKTVKRDGLAGMKLQRIFFMTNSPGPRDSLFQQTSQLIGEDPLVLGAVKEVISGVALHDSLLEEDHQGDYGDAEFSSYEHYKRRGGIGAYADACGSAAGANERVASSQRDLVLQGKTLSDLLKSILEERANASPLVKEGLRRMGIQVELTGECRCLFHLKYQRHEHRRDVDDLNIRRQQLLRDLLVARGAPEGSRCDCPVMIDDDEDTDICFLGGGAVQSPGDDAPRQQRPSVNDVVEIDD